MTLLLLVMVSRLFVSSVGANETGKNVRDAITVRAVDETGVRD
jgi:hypothetical protein